MLPPVSVSYLNGHTIVSLTHAALLSVSCPNGHTIVALTHAALAFCQLSEWPHYCCINTCCPCFLSAIPMATLSVPFIAVLVLQRGWDRAVNLECYVQWWQWSAAECVASSDVMWCCQMLHCDLLCCRRQLLSCQHLRWRLSGQSGLIALLTSISLFLLILPHPDITSILFLTVIVQVCVLYWGLKHNKLITIIITSR